MANKLPKINEKDEFAKSIISFSCKKDLGLLPIHH